MVLLRIRDGPQLEAMSLPWLLTLAHLQWRRGRIQVLRQLSKLHHRVAHSTLIARFMGHGEGDVCFMVINTVACSHLFPANLQ